MQTDFVEKRLSLLETKVIRISGKIITPPVPWKNRFKYLLLVNKNRSPDLLPLAGKTFLCFSKEYPADAYSITLEGVVHIPERRKNRFEFDEHNYFQANGISGKIETHTIIAMEPPRTVFAMATMHFRTWLSSVLQCYRNTYHRAIIRASFTGEQDCIAPEIITAFTHSGLIHLLALSGFNITVLLAAIYCILAIVPVSRPIKHVVALLILWLYVGFVGPIPSLTRAIIMATIVILSIMLQQKNYPMQTLCIAGIVWLFFSPTSLFQPGFQLSYGATFGILAVHPILISLYPGCKQPIVDYMGRLLFTSLSVSIAAFLTTLPIILYHFGLVSVYGIFANIAAIPLMTGAMWLFFIALILYSFIPIISNLLISCSGLLTDWLLFFAHLPDRIPFSYFYLPVPYPELFTVYCCMLLIIISINREYVRGAAALCIPLLFCMIPGVYLLHRHFGATEIVIFLNKHEYPGVVIRFPDGQSWVLCKSEQRAVHAMVRRTINPWARHHPGTRIRAVYIFNRKGQCKDITSGSIQQKIFEADTMVLSDTRRTYNHFFCRYIPDTNRLTVTMEFATIDIILNEDYITLFHNRKGVLLQQHWAPPIKIRLKSSEYAVHSYE